ncbi:MAG: hypothetical protein HGA25_09835 [Clostridiales bacterium]|nr:hypothetical protein [Clostridiales bacterium]
MKNIFKFIPLIFIAIAISGIYSSCSKDDSGSNNGMPIINYVRITRPTASDSLLVAAGQGQLIAIMGDNLQDTREIWFNDQQASLIPTYITSSSILVYVPSHIPLTLTNKLKIIFTAGDSLLYDFKVSINKPTITSMDCEYVLPGNVATIHGNYFYEPISVTFPGGLKGTNVSVNATNTTLTVTVPDAAPGTITVTTNFGATESDFWFKDNRNIFVSSDPYSGWWNASFVVNYPGTSVVPAINGNYIRVVQVFSPWGWTEIAGGPAAAMGNISKNIPDEAILRPSLYNLKFEVCTTKPYNGCRLMFCVGVQDGDHGNYNWNPPVDTKGQWETIVIPYDEVVKAYTVPLIVNPDGYYTRMVFQGPTGLDCDMSFDNFRVVPKIIKK